LKIAGKYSWMQAHLENTFIFMEKNNIFANKKAVGKNSSIALSLGDIS
jgi:hypothetical protein